MDRKICQNANFEKREQKLKKGVDRWFSGCYDDPEININDNVKVNVDQILHLLLELNGHWMLI